MSTTSRCSSVLGGTYSSLGIQGLNDGWMVPEARAAAMGDRRTSRRRPGGQKKGWKITQKAQLAVASPLETIVTLLKANVGPVVTAGTIKFKGYRVRYPQIPDPSRKSGQSDARGHVASVDVVLS